MYLLFLVREDMVRVGVYGTGPHNNAKCLSCLLVCVLCIIFFCSSLDVSSVKDMLVNRGQKVASVLCTSVVVV